MSFADYKKVETTLHCYLDTTINSIGSILCLITIIVFLNPKFKESYYNYIRMELFFTFLTLFVFATRANYYCHKLSQSTSLNSYLVNLIHYLNRYFRHVFEMTACVGCILSSCDFYLLLFNMSKSKFNFLAKISYKLVALITVIISHLMFSCILFEYEVKPIKTNNSTNSTSTGYSIESSKYSTNIFLRLNKIISFIILDYITVIILIIFNVLIYIRIKRVIKKKRYMNK
jgi:hypothetical protein